MIANNHETYRIAERFAEYLLDPGAATAVSLAESLDHDRSEPALRARMLRAFAERGEHSVVADWWARDARCQVSLQPPAVHRPWHLWFDPLEVSFALLVPGPGGVQGAAGWRSWVSLTAVTDWQIVGAHRMASTLPTRPGDYSADDAAEYAGLFGKTVTSAREWVRLRDCYGQNVFRRLWGDHVIEYGSGSATSGLAEVTRLQDLLHDDPDREVTVVDELLAFGYAFRTSTDVRVGVDVGFGALPRTWST